MGNDELPCETGPVISFRLINEKINFFHQVGIIQWINPLSFSKISTRNDYHFRNCYYITILFIIHVFCEFQIRKVFLKIHIFWKSFRKSKFKLDTPLKNEFFLTSGSYLFSSEWILYWWKWFEKQINYYQIQQFVYKNIVLENVFLMVAAIKEFIFKNNFLETHYHFQGNISLAQLIWFFQVIKSTHSWILQVQVLS